MLGLPGLGVPELLLLIVLALIIFGPGKLPDVGRSVGRAINEFRRASTEISREHTAPLKNEEEEKPNEA